MPTQGQHRSYIPARGVVEIKMELVFGLNQTAHESHTPVNFKLKIFQVAGGMRVVFHALAYAEYFL